MTEGMNTMRQDSWISVDVKQVEHLELPEGFLPLLVGTVLRFYGERLCFGGYPADRPFFLAAYFLPTATIYTSVLVDPEQLLGDMHDDAIEYGRDEPMVADSGFVLSATVTNEIVAEPGMIGCRTMVVLDSHFEGAQVLRGVRP
ncbi:MAG: hypothetical protein C6W59_11730 [Paenibacillaceae bacterium]|nr:MAG: hypothetical protein C6W59_11730 [Paenibacillaceae bacterium]